MRVFACRRGTTPSPRRSSTASWRRMTSDDPQLRDGPQVPDRGGGEELEARARPPPCSPRARTGCPARGPRQDAEGRVHADRQEGRDGRRAAARTRRPRGRSTRRPPPRRRTRSKQWRIDDLRRAVWCSASRTSSATTCPSTSTTSPRAAALGRRPRVRAPVARPAMSRSGPDDADGAVAARPGRPAGSTRSSDVQLPHRYGAEATGTKSLAPDDQNTLTVPLNEKAEQRRRSRSARRWRPSSCTPCRT